MKAAPLQKQTGTPSPGKKRARADDGQPQPAPQRKTARRISGKFGTGHGTPSPKAKGSKAPSIGGSAFTAFQRGPAERKMMLKESSGSSTTAPALSKKVSRRLAARAPDSSKKKDGPKPGSAAFLMLHKQFSQRAAGSSKTSSSSGATSCKAGCGISHKAGESWGNYELKIGKKARLHEGVLNPVDDICGKCDRTFWNGNFEMSGKGPAEFLESLNDNSDLKQEFVEASAVQENQDQGMVVPFFRQGCERVEATRVKAIVTKRGLPVKDSDCL